jgi:hypothetical protein
VRLAGLLLETRDYPAALSLLGRLLTEVKRLDDKLLLVEIHLLESKASKGTLKGEGDMWHTRGRADGWPRACGTHSGGAGPAAGATDLQATATDLRCIVPHHRCTTRCATCPKRARR